MGFWVLVVPSLLLDGSVDVYRRNLIGFLFQSVSYNGSFSSVEEKQHSQPHLVVTRPKFVNAVSERRGYGSPKFVPLTPESLQPVDTSIYPGRPPTVGQTTRSEEPSRHLLHRIRPELAAPVPPWPDFIKEFRKKVKLESRELRSEPGAARRRALENLFSLSLLPADASARLTRFPRPLKRFQRLQAESS